MLWTRSSIQRCTVSQVHVTHVVEVCTEPELSQFKPAGSFNTRQPLTHPDSPHLLHGMRDRTGKGGKGEEIIIWIWKTSDVQCSHALPTDQCPGSFQAAGAPGQVSFPSRLFIYWTWCHMAWNIPLVNVSALPAVSPHNFLFPSAWWGGIISWKVLGFVASHCLATIKTSVNYQHYSHSKSKTTLYQLLGRKSSLSQQKPGHLSRKVFWYSVTPWLLLVNCVTLLFWAVCGCICCVCCSLAVGTYWEALQPIAWRDLWTDQVMDRAALEGGIPWQRCCIRCVSWLADCTSAHKLPTTAASACTVCWCSPIDLSVKRNYLTFQFRAGKWNLPGLKASFSCKN